MAFKQIDEIIISVIKRVKYKLFDLLRDNKKVYANKGLGNIGMGWLLMGLEKNLFKGSEKYAPAGQDVQIVFDAKGDGVKDIIMGILLF